MNLKKSLLFLCLLIFTGNAFAAFISIDKARTVAKNLYYERINHFEETSLENVIFDNEYLVEKSNHAVYYVFNIQNNQGFVLIAADDNVFPILAYSFEGRMEQHKETVPPVEEFLINYQNEIVYIIEKQELATQEITETWNRYASEDFEMQTLQTVGPIIETKWDQGFPYNSLCPGGSVTGCVATAMAQIMRYYKHPNIGTGSNTYYHSSYGYLTADFGATTYNYANMPLSPTSSNNDVATLNFHCGVSVEMNYSPYGSSASTAYAPTPFKSNFGYSTTTSYESRDNYTDIQWKILLRAEHMNYRPVMYRGSGSGGHAFICDGFQYPHHFHFNWGWGGSYDGYFYLTSLNPGSSYNFTTGQGGILDLYPDPYYATVSIQEEEADNGLTVYPNPSDGNMNLGFDHYLAEEILIMIYDMNGRMVSLENVNVEGFNHVMKLENIQSGNYQMIITGENLHLVETLIIK
jgi:hypothetical protein